MTRFQVQLLLLLPALITLIMFSHRVNSLPLSTRGRWVVDAASGHRVKLRCVNWAAHMPATLAEGLDRQLLATIAARVADLGFNCVRLTWATHLFTKPHYQNLTVSKSLGSLGLTSALVGIEENNPSMVGITVREAYEAVVRAIGEAGLMVVLDNHVSRPQWCCGDDDGNGFFGDLYFDPDEWLRGLETVAKRFKGFPQVVGMSMRNELRGPKQRVGAWYTYMTRGARTIHKANPDLLVIVSGLKYDTDLSFLGRKAWFGLIWYRLAARPLPENYDNKLVLEAHWYAFSTRRREDWDDQAPSQVCSREVRRFEQRSGFVARGATPTPLFVSEFGVDQRGVNRADNRYLSCFLAYAAERDLDWAMWALQGSYYRRNGEAGFEETYGVLDSDWNRTRNPKFQERFRLVQEILQDPGSQVPPYQVIYHPLSGLCVSADTENAISLSDCRDRSRWSYHGNGAVILLNGLRILCLKAVGDGLPVILSTECSDRQSLWKLASSSGFQIAGVDAQGRRLCLTASSSNSSAILSEQCFCLEGSTCSENPQTQWFRFISLNVA